MGEYATYKGEQVKIGTCESMYYLRYDQRERVTWMAGNVNPAGPEACELRFRFPWPDEDAIPPGGNFDPYERSVPVHGLQPPADVEHYTVQFSARAGYLVSLPCPESGKFPSDLPFHRNGFSGAVHLCYQKPTEDGKTLRLVLRCGGCGAMWRLETWEDAEPVIVALRAEGDRARQNNGNPEFWNTIADRAAAGYGK